MAPVRRRLVSNFENVVSRGSSTVPIIISTEQDRRMNKDTHFEMNISSSRVQMTLNRLFSGLLLWLLLNVMIDDFGKTGTYRVAT